MDRDFNNSPSSGSTSAPVMDIQSPKATPAPSPFAPAEPTSSGGSNQPPDPIKTPELMPPKHGKPIGAIAMAVIIAIGLSALATYTYVKTNQTAQPATTNTTVQEQATTTSDVDDTTKALDESVNSVDEAEDFPENDLTDAALGL